MLCIIFQSIIRVSDEADDMVKKTKLSTNKKTPSAKKSNFEKLIVLIQTEFAKNRSYFENKVDND